MEGLALRLFRILRGSGHQVQGVTPGDEHHQVPPPHLDPHHHQQQLSPMQQHQLQQQHGMHASGGGRLPYDSEEVRRDHSIHGILGGKKNNLETWPSFYTFYLFQTTIATLTASLASP